jgi:PD-(D/E)XK endonuclease
VQNGDGKLKPRQQGDLGELSAMTWLTQKGADVFRPILHSPDVDLIALFPHDLIRVEVKTSNQHQPNARWPVVISTRGGNQSWEGLVKYFDPTRCDYLFVHVGDGRRWFIPTEALECRSALMLGGPKYSEFEIEPAWPLVSAPVKSEPAEGEYPSGQRTAPVKRQGESLRRFESCLPHAFSISQRFQPSRYERRLGKSGRAVINQKRRVTIPQSALVEAGLRDGDVVRARGDGAGRIVLEKIGRPVWAEPVHPSAASATATKPATPNAQRSS